MIERASGIGMDGDMDMERQSGVLYICICGEGHLTQALPLTGGVQWIEGR